MMYFPLFLVFPLYKAWKKYKDKEKRLDEILLAYKNNCIANSSEYSTVTSIGNEENTIQHHLEAILQQSLPPKEIHLFVEARDRTYDKIVEVLRKYNYVKKFENKIEEHLKEDEWEWNKHLIVKLEKYVTNGKPDVIIYRSIGDVLGKGLSINWLVKRGHINTPYFLQLDADAIVEPELSKKLLCTLKQDGKISAVYAFSYEIPEKPEKLESKILAYAYNIYKRIAHVIFRLSWNFWDFHYTLEGPHVMFRTNIYRKVPRPIDTLAGDTAHAWELQFAGYRILVNIYSLDNIKEVSTFKQLYKQRIKWNSGPIQNLLIRGKKLLKIKPSTRKYKALLEIFYYSFMSPLYQTFWLYAPFFLNFNIYKILLFYTIDSIIHLASALYSTYILKKIHNDVYKKESLFQFVPKFFMYYFILRPIVAFTYLIAYFKTLYEWFIKKRRKWFLTS